jgi:hypothetical protein
MKKIKKDYDTLWNEVIDCERNCSDYSCVRSFGCTGNAGHAMTDYWMEKRQQEKDDKERERIKKLLGMT